MLCESVFQNHLSLIGMTLSGVQMARLLVLCRSKADVSFTPEMGLCHAARCWRMKGSSICRPEPVFFAASATTSINPLI